MAGRGKGSPEREPRKGETDCRLTDEKASDKKKEIRGNRGRGMCQVRWQLHILLCTVIALRYGGTGGRYSKVGTVR